MTDADNADSADIVRAADLLRAGDLVAFPTETVYGLGADARNPTAVGNIFRAKGRPADHPLIVHLADIASLPHWAIDIPASAYALAAAFWPGPLTLILQRHPSVIDAISGGQDTIGLRIPNHPLALQLLREFNRHLPGGGLAAPSANRFGRISPTTAAHVREELGESVAAILDGGPCAVGIESTILDLSGTMPRILRPGRIGVDEIRRVLGASPAEKSPQTAPRVSGSLDAHYAPRTPLRLVAAADLHAEVDRALQSGVRLAVLSTHADPQRARLVWQRVGTDSREFARQLYAELRRLDACACDLILVEIPAADAIGHAVMDRLRRAATGSGAGE